MSKKSTKQATPKAKGRAHTIAKSMPPRRATKGRPAAEEPPVELIIDAKGIHRVSGPADEPQAQDEMVVFAIRLTKAERDAIHAAAGPGKATKFVRTLAVAAARGDSPTVLGILDRVQK
jgi:hypothetical protein